MVSPCSVQASMVTVNGSTTILSNGILQRVLTEEATGSETTLYTSAVLLLGRDITSQPVPESTMVINDQLVYVGGPKDLPNPHLWKQARLADRPRLISGMEKRFDFEPGQHHSETTRAWPPKGITVELDFSLPCNQVNAGTVGIQQPVVTDLLQGMFNITVSYGVANEVPAVTKKIRFVHSCSGSIGVYNMTVGVLTRQHDFESFADAGISESFHDDAMFGVMTFFNGFPRIHKGTLLIDASSKVGVEL